MKKLPEREKRTKILACSAVVKRGEIVIVGDWEYKVLGIKPTAREFMNDLTVKAVRKARAGRDAGDKQQICIQCGARIYGEPMQGQCGNCGTYVKPTMIALFERLKMYQRDNDKKVKFLERKLRKQMNHKLTLMDAYMSVKGEQLIIQEVLPDLAEIIGYKR